jgi:hypothetical protein
LQHAFPLDVPIVSSSARGVAADGECLSCGGFSLGETICFWSLEFIVDRFGGMSLSPSGDVSGTIVADSTRGGPSSPPWTMMGDSIEEFPVASNGEGWIDLLSPKRHGTGAPPVSAMTIPRLENPPIARATATIPPWQATLRSDTNLPSSDGALVGRPYNDGAT